MKFLYPLIITLVITTTTLSQEVHFTQFYASGTYLNPALVGIEKQPKITANYRNQWPGIQNSFVTYNASLEMYSAPLHGGIGIGAFQDRAGDGAFTTSSINTSYAYEIEIDRRFFVRTGIRMSIMHKNVNWNKLIFSDMIDPSRGVIYSTQQMPSPSITYTDLSIGAVFYSKRLFGGIAMDHINKPKEGLSSYGSASTPVRYTFHGGAQIPFTSLYEEEKSISPNILISKQKDFLQVNIGLHLKLNSFVIGTWYRGKDALILLVGIETNKIRVGYSYDVTTSSLAYQAPGSHEVSYAVYFKSKNRKKKNTSIPCPVF